MRPSILPILYFFLFLLPGCSEERHPPLDEPPAFEVRLPDTGALRCLDQLILEEQYVEATVLLAGNRTLNAAGGCNYQEAELAYFQARLTYQRGDFPTALDQARRALGELLRDPDLVSNNTIIQCMHLLAELHFDHQRYEDSTAVYQQWAASRIRDDTPETILAENQLCLALCQIENYAYSTQVAAARLGRSILDKLPIFYSDRYARLLVAEGLGLKKYADKQSTNLQKALLEQASALMTRAVELYLEIGSIRWREAQREKIIIVSRFGDRNRFEQELALLTAPKEMSVHRSAIPTVPPPFGFPDRLRGYFHHKTELHPDSVLYYYRRFQPAIPSFDFHLQDETNWTLIQYGLRSGDLDLVQRKIRDQLVLYRCCNEDQAALPLDRLLGVVSGTYSCKYALSDLGRLKLEQYRKEGSWAALDEALDIFDYILQQWEKMFTTGDEESAVAQLQDITHRIIKNANEAAWAGYRQEPTAQRADRLLRTLEKTKAFLLLKDRLVMDADTNSTLPMDSLRYWQSQINLLADLEMRTGNLSLADRRRLLGLKRRHRELSELTERSGQGIYSTRSDQLPGIGALRNLTSEGEAILVFGEGEGRLLAQYVDADTVIAYSSPSLPPLTERIATLLSMLEAGAGKVKLTEYQEVAQHIYEDVLGPVADPLAQRQRLLIVTEGPLRRLPFEALIRNIVSEAEGWGSLCYLARDLEVTYAPSLRMELINREHSVADLQTARVGTWIHPRLSHYFTEVKTRLVSRSWDHVLFAGDDCHSDTFRRKCDDFDVINLVVHAEGDPYSAYRNYLHFAPADSLNGTSIVQLNCRAKLVFLNACEGGLGAGAIGEGNFSIARSFQQVGVPHVIYSLWRIPAKASDTVHARFYDYLGQGLPIATALARAKRDLIGGKESAAYAFPGSWAGLVKG